MCSPLHRLMATWSKPRHDLGPEPERRSLRKAKQAAARRRLVLEGCFHRKGRSLYLGSWKAEQTLSTGFLSLVDCCLHTASFWFLMAGPPSCPGPWGAVPFSTTFYPQALGTQIWKQLDSRKRWAGEEVQARNPPKGQPVGKLSPDAASVQGPRNLSQIRGLLQSCRGIIHKVLLF